MVMNFEELTPEVRRAMEVAFDAEQATGRPYESKVMSEEGLRRYPDLFRDAFRSGNESTLASHLSDSDFWRATDGRGATVNPVASATRLALTEFNTWYVAGLASVLMQEGQTHCEVYRAENPEGAEGDCSVHEEQVYPLSDVLEGHRIGYWPREGKPVRGAFSVPALSNCHHSIRRVATPPASSEQVDV